MNAPHGQSEFARRQQRERTGWQQPMAQTSPLLTAAQALGACCIVVPLILAGLLL